MMKYPELIRADEKLEKASFDSKSWDDLSINDVVRGGREPVAYRPMSDIADSEHVVLSVPPYGNSISHDHMAVRLAAQQIALGDGYAVVGVDVHDSQDLKMTSSERRQVARGDFSHFGKIILRTIDHLNLRDDQRVSLYGYSMGGDVAVAAAHENCWNVHHGMRKIETLGPMSQRELYAGEVLWWARYLWRRLLPVRGLIYLTM